MAKGAEAEVGAAREAHLGKEVDWALARGVVEAVGARVVPPGAVALVGA